MLIMFLLILQGLVMWHILRLLKSSGCTRNNTYLFTLFCCSITGMLLICIVLNIGLLGVEVYILIFAYWWQGCIRHCIRYVQYARNRTK